MLGSMGHMVVELLNGSQSNLIQRHVPHKREAASFQIVFIARLRCGLQSDNKRRTIGFIHKLLQRWGILLRLLVVHVREESAICFCKVDKRLTDRIATGLDLFSFAAIHRSALWSCQAATRQRRRPAPAEYQ